MRTAHGSNSLILGISVIVAAAMLVSAGDLNPPAGPVTPTMKGLDWVEPRTVISLDTTPGDADSLFRITQPGSYYLVGDVQGVANKHGIEIACDNVTIDMMGFTLAGTPGAAAIGIRNEPGFRGVTILNGVVRDWTDDGISLSGARLYVEGVKADRCGASGFDLAGSNGPTTIVRCQAVANTIYGINTGSGATVVECTANSNSLSGINLGGSGGVCERNTTIFNTFSGIAQNSGGGWVIRNNTCSQNGENGINVCTSNSIVGNVCNLNGTAVTDGAGIYVRCGDNRVDSNHLSSNDIGVRMTTNGEEVIIRNTFHDNTTSFSGSTGNDIGPLSLASNAVSPFANIIH